MSTQTPNSIPSLPGQSSSGQPKISRRRMARSSCDFAITIAWHECAKDRSCDSYILSDPNRKNMKTLPVGSLSETICAAKSFEVLCCESMPEPRVDTPAPNERAALCRIPLRTNQDWPLRIFDFGNIATRPVSHTAMGQSGDWFAGPLESENLQTSFGVVHNAMRHLFFHPLWPIAFDLCGPNAAHIGRLSHQQS